MSLFGSPGLEAPGAARRSIRSTFTATVAAPVVCLILLWGLVMSAMLAGLLASHGFSARYHRLLVELTAIVGASLVVVLVSAVLMGMFARRVSREVSALEATARYLSDDQLAHVVEQLRQGERAPSLGDRPLQPPMRIAEIARAARAIAGLQHTAVMATVGEARLRNGVGDVFVSLARRNQSLLQKQLRLIDELEQKAPSPAALADIFPLDHLTTRMRRQAESLILLAGSTAGRSWTEPVPVVDVIRAALAEIEHYQRVVVRAVSEDAVAGPAAADMIHLLAELFENAVEFSPPSTQVEVRAERVAGGVTVEIDDRGLGIKPTQLGIINQQLTHPPDFDLANADQLGIFVVGKLASRHGVRVTLRSSPYGGTTAIVLLPARIVGPVASDSPRLEGDAGSGASALPVRRRGIAALPARTAPATPAAPAALTRDPAEARALLSAMQNGWRRGREANSATDQNARAADPPARAASTPAAGQPGTSSPAALPTRAAATHRTPMPSPAQHGSDRPGSEVEE